MHILEAYRPRRGVRRVNNGMRLLLVGELDVHESCEHLDGGLVLGMVEEVSLAGLESGIPLRDIEWKFARLNLWEGCL